MDQILQSKDSGRVNLKKKRLNYKLPTADSIHL